MNPKPSSHFILFTIILLLASLACTTVTDFFEEPALDNPQEPVPVAPPVGSKPLSEPAPDANYCPAITDKILEVATEFYEDDSDGGSDDEPDQLYLVSYTVSENRITDPTYYEDVSANLTSFQEDEVSHQEIWDYFTMLIPAGERKSLAEYSIVTDGVGDILAAVSQTQYDPNLWSLEVDIRDSEDKLNLTYTLIHEYAHLLTLSSDQVTPSEAIFNNPDDDKIYYDEVNICPDYFPGEGCSLPDSYINVYFNEFWAAIHAEWQDINLIEDDDSYYEALNDFYYNYEDRFVTDYAATNPEEDIAEAFTFFVLAPRPNGNTIAEEKILFFYDYPELVELRDDITSGICSLNQ